MIKALSEFLRKVGGKKKKEKDKRKYRREENKIHRSYAIKFGINLTNTECIDNVTFINYSLSRMIICI